VIALTLLGRSMRQARFVLVPCLLLLTAFQFILVAQAASIESTRSFDRLAAFIPAFLQRGAGPSALVLATFRGTVAFGYFHPVILILISMLSMYVASEPAYDVETGRVDLVLARSIPRRRLITRSLVLALVVPVLAAAAMMAGSWIALQAFASPDSDWPAPGTILRLAVYVVAVAWSLGALALAVGASVTRWSTAFASVAVSAIALYLIDLFALGWPIVRVVSWISPFHYYPALLIVAGTATHDRGLFILWAATVVLVGVAYWVWEKRDL
jgi:ABC-type transport system involved in multi-copper enzyme maturation permease subunit